MDVLPFPICAVPVLTATCTPLMARFVFSLVTTASIIWVSLLADKSAERTRSTSVGRISLPSLAMAAATIAFCNGVTTVSPWPIDANASLSSLMSVGNFDVTDTHGVPV